MAEQKTWRRAHPLRIGLRTVEWIRTFIGVIIGYGLISIRFDTVVWLAVGAIACVVGPLGMAVAEWITTQYEVNDQHIAVRKGVFNRTEHAIAWQQVRSLHIAEPWVLRLCKLMNITVSAKGADADIVLACVPGGVRAELEHMRTNAELADTAVHAYADTNTAHTAGNEHVDADTNSTAIRTKSSHDTADRADYNLHSTVRSAAPIPVFMVSMRDIVLYAVTNINIIAGIAALYTLYNRLPDIWATQAQEVITHYAFHNILSTIVAIVAGIMLALVISIGIAILRWMNFSISLSGDAITIARGALSRTTQTITISRIQGVIIRQTVLRRLLHLSTVSVITGASDSDSDDKQAQSGKIMVIPVVRTSQVDAIMHTILPDWNVQYADESHVRYSGRLVKRYYLLEPGITTALCGVASIAAVSYVYATDMLRTDADTALGVYSIAGIAMLISVWRLMSRIAEQHFSGYEILDQYILRYVGYSGMHIEQVITHHKNIQLCRRRVPIWRVRGSRIGALGCNVGILSSMQVLYWRALRLEDTDRIMRWFVR